MSLKNVFYLPVRSILFILIFILISVYSKTSLTEISGFWTMAVILVNVFTILILLFICKKEKINYLDLIKYKKGNTKIKSVVLFSLVSIIAGIGGMYIAGFICYNELPYLPAMMVKPIPVVLSIIVILILPITTTLAEDGLYLGVGVNNINNKYCAILIPAFFYAIQHSFIPFHFDTQFIIYRFISFLPLTILFCGYYYCKKNPLPLMIGHFILNIAAVFQIFIFTLFPEMYEEMINV